MIPRSPNLTKYPKGTLAERDRKGRQVAFEPTEEQRKAVRAMAAYGTPQEQIRAVLDVSDPTLRKYFRRELETAAPEANARVAQSLFKMATEGKSVAAAIFWLKVRAGWKESATRLEHVGEDGGPIKSVSLVTDDPLEAARAYQKLMGD